MKMKLKFANYMANTANRKQAAGSYFQKAYQRSKTKDMGKSGKTAQRVFRGIGTGLLGCGEDGSWIQMTLEIWKGSKQMEK